MGQSSRMQIEGKFDQIKGRIKEAWGDLTDDDLRRTEGKWDRLVGTIRERTGETAEAVEKKLSNLFDKAESKH